MITSFKNWTDKCETKAVSESISITLQVAGSFCLYQAHTEFRVGHHSEIKSQGPSKAEYKKYCLNGGDYLVGEDILGCNCAWLF